MQPQAEPSPYVGSRHFERTEEDRRRFFGRDPEVDELVALVLSHNLLLVYAVSGAGKTSILNAGVIPKLLDEGFEVLPRGRVGVSLSSDTALEKTTNPYVLSLLCSLSPETEVASLLRRPIADHLRELPRVEGSAGRVLVIDQSEELFTFLPKDWQLHQKEFFLALRDALRDAPDLRVILVTREDYLARFDDFAPLLPGGLRMRLHLEPLSRTSARDAVVGPLAGTRWTFEDGVADQIVADLSKMKLGTGTGDAREEPGPHVEPVQLQIVCSALWDKLPDGVEVITAEHLQRFGDVEETLERFYEETIDACVRETRCDKEKLLRWFGAELITPSDTRGQVFRGSSETKGLPNPVVAFLEARHLVHADERASGRWYELAHDRLVRPIRTVNERWTKAFDAARTRRRTRRAVLRGAGGVLTALLLLGTLAATIAVPKLRAQSQERALTVGRIEDLRQHCSTSTSGCDEEKVRVFDFVADYYWRQDKTAELVALLKGEAALIPSNYGMPALASAQTGDDSSHATLLKIEYNPDRRVDEWRMRSEWTQLAQDLGRSWGLPVTPHIELVATEQVALSEVRIVAIPRSCTERAKDAPVLSSVQMPAAEGPALISLNDINKDERLHRFFDEYSLQDGWKEYKELKINGPWWFVPAWTLPIWRVGGHPAQSREAILAVVVATELTKRPDLVLGCEGLKVVLQRVSDTAPVSIREAVAARTLEGLRLDFIELVRAKRQDLTYPPTLLDVLANHPGATTSEAAGFARKAQVKLDEGSVPLHGPWQASVPFDAEKFKPGGLYKEISAHLSTIKQPIRVELGPALVPVLVEGGVLREETQQWLTKLRRGLYLRYGVEAPGVRFRASDNEGVRVEVLNQDAGSPEAQTIVVSPREAPERLVRELGTRYRDYRASWLTAETISWSLARMRTGERDWLESHYSLTDLKRLSRAVVTGVGVSGGRDGSDTLRDLPWLLRSLPFWIHTCDPKDVIALANAFRVTQRARLRPSDDTRHDLDGRVAGYMRRGLGALDTDRTREAEAQFAAAIRVDRNAAIAAFLAMYPALSSLAPDRRRQSLSAACRLPLPGTSSAAPDTSVEYEVQDLLADTHETLTVIERQRFELCLLWSVAENAPELPREVQHRLSALLAESPVATWTTDEAFFLARRWLSSNQQQMLPPTLELSAIRQLLTRSLKELPPEKASSVWNETLLKDLGGNPRRWTRDLIAEVAATLPTGWPSLKLELAEWLAGFGEADAKRALGLVDKIAPGRNANERWSLAYVRARILSHLGEYGEPAQRAQRLDDAAAALVALTRDAPDRQRVGHAFSELADVYRKSGDDKNAREAVRAGIENSHNPGLFDQSKFWIEIGEKDAHRAGDIVAEMVRRAPDDIGTLYVDAMFATLTRRADFERAARLFIFHDSKDAHPYVDYVCLMLFWALSEQGRDADAKQLLDKRMRDVDGDSWAARLQQRDSMVWREMLVALFAGKIAESRVFDPLHDDASFRASGLDQTELSLSGSRCEVYFYVALRERVTGDRATRDVRFREALQRVIETHEYAYLEYSMARYLLGRTGT